MTIVKQTTSMAHLGGERFANLDFPVPPLPEQHQIAAVLDTIDDAIRRTEQIIAKLKQVKQGLLHDLLTRGIDDNGELRDPERHPEQFKDSPLGRIPKEWEVGSLERWLEGSPKNGHSPQAVEEWTGRLMLGLGCLTLEGFVPLQLKNAPRNDPRLEGAMLKDGDLLLSRANTRDLVGLAGIYRDIGQPCTYPDLMMRLTPSLHLTTTSFLELILRAPAVRRQIQAAASGTSGSMVKISGAIVKRLQVAIPSPEEQARLIEGSRSVQAKIDDERHQSAKLRLLKQGLMEDLLTGRVRVAKLLQGAAP
jgi:type I restriction enzyme S subunit